jgi:hypothetical protein
LRAACLEPMSFAHLPRWDVTPIELALDLETPQLPARPALVFSGPAEPRICLVAAFALTSHLKRIAAAVDRAAPARAPGRLRIAASRARTASLATVISVQPMLTLLRLQARLIRAIEPGLAHHRSLLPLALSHNMNETAVHFIHDFIASKAPPTFEPPSKLATFAPVAVKAVGITLYRLSRRGVPESILAHWAYPQHHLRRGP